MKPHVECSMMKTCRYLFLLGALLVLSGCPETQCDVGGIAQGSSPHPAMILVGEPVSLRLSPTLVSNCGREFQESPSSLTLEVYGPDNLPVASQATLGKPSTSSATLKFTADKPGRYHVFAAFDPIGGIHQFDLYAARDRSAEAPVFTLPKLCSSLERTQRGGWVCDQEFLREGSVEQRFISSRVAVAGDVVWVVGSSQVQRYVDTGTALELTASMPSSLSSAEFLLASEAELLAMRGLTLQRVTYEGTAALREPGTVQLPSTSGLIGTTGLRVLLVRSGDWLGVVTSAPRSGGGPPPPNSFTQQICAYRIEPNRILRTTDPCQLFTGNVVGYEPDVIWVGALMFGEHFADLRRLEWSAEGIAEQASLPLGTNFKMSVQPVSPRNQVVPVVASQISALNLRPRSTVPVYSPERRTLFLELLDTELTAPTASGSLMWTNPTSGASTSRVRVRPAAP
jgi:hypothetical protein